MKVAVSSLGSSLDAWTGAAFGTCSQFLVIDTESMDYVVISVPPDQIDPSKVSLYAIRALANQGVQAVLTGPIKDICRQAMINLGMEVIDGLQRMTVREAVELIRSQGPQAVTTYEPPPARIAVASHGDNLDATLSHRGEPCTSFVLVDPQTMAFETIEVETGETPEQTSVNAVRAAARGGATIVITPQIRPVCCAALRALAIAVALAGEDMTVREAVQAYQRGELHTPPYL
jgi:predicted Fe-Mo cluster-binding NifX family protein